jgi:hypothetical protein
MDMYANQSLSNSMWAKEDPRWQMASDASRPSWTISEGAVMLCWFPADKQMCRV